MEKIKIEYFFKRQKDRNDSVWYDGNIAELTYKDREVLVIAVGEIRIMSQRGIVFDGKERNEGVK